MCNVVDENSTFYLFAYGSNMSSERIHMVVPAAKFYGIGELKNFELAADHYSERWKGCVYSFVPSSGKSIWGVIWIVPSEATNQLDKQGAINKGIYQRRTVEILVNDNSINCVTYWFPTQSNKDDKYSISELYKNVLIKGAVEHNLPSEYINYLKVIPTNGRGIRDRVQQYMLV